VIRGRCGVNYFDETYHQTQLEQEPQMDAVIGEDDDFNAPLAPVVNTELDFFEEDIEVSMRDMYERLHVPKFDEVEETVVWHDFTKVRITLE
jgi:hypothetical protein